MRSIATSLGRAPSTVSREIRRNGGLKAYCANQADEHAWDRARRSKPCKLVENRELAEMIASAGLDTSIILNKHERAFAIYFHGTT
jgi:IS30 family transposase